MVFTPQELAGQGVFLNSQCFFCHHDTTQITFDAPYMHDGRFATLRDVVEHYDHRVKDSPNLHDPLREHVTRVPKRLNLSEEQKDALVAFLNTLTDETFLSDPRFSDPFQ